MLTSERRRREPCGMSPLYSNETNPNKSHLTDSFRGLRSTERFHNGTFQYGTKRSRTTIPLTKRMRYLYMCEYGFQYGIIFHHLIATGYHHISLPFVLVDADNATIKG